LLTPHETASTCLTRGLRRLRSSTPWPSRGRETLPAADEAVPLTLHLDTSGNTVSVMAPVVLVPDHAQRVQPLSEHTLGTLTRVSPLAAGSPAPLPASPEE
jgi:hypothetical protein